MFEGRWACQNRNMSQRSACSWKTEPGSGSHLRKKKILQLYRFTITATEISHICSVRSIRIQTSYHYPLMPFSYSLNGNLNDSWNKLLITQGESICFSRYIKIPCVCSHKYILCACMCTSGDKTIKKIDKE